MYRVPVLLLLVAIVNVAAAESAGMVMLHSRHGFTTLELRLTRAIADHRMGLVAQASASRGAASRGLAIPGNAVLMVFRNDYAVRMLEASVEAGFEAPLRFYVTENRDGTATLRYRRPSAVFAPYAHPDLDTLAAELDPLFDAIARDAVSE